MKFIKHWGFVLSISVISLFLLLFFVLYFNWISLPNSGYSKGVELFSYKIGTNFEDYKKSAAQVISTKEGFYTFVNEKNYLLSYQYDSYGNFINLKTFTTDLNHTHYTFSFENDLLSAKAYNTKTQSIDWINLSNDQTPLTYKPLIHIGSVEQLNLLSHAGIFYKDGFVYLTDFKKVKSISSAKYFESMLLKQDNEGSHHVLITHFIDKGYILEHYKLSTDTFFNQMSNKELIPTHLIELSTGSMYVPTEMDFIKWNNQYHYSVVIKDTKTGMNQLLWQTKDLMTNKDLAVKKMEPGYFLHPTFYLDHNQLLLAYNKGTSVGKVEIGSSHSVFENIVSTHFDTFSNYVEITKSIQPSIYPTFFEMNNQKFALYSRNQDGNVQVLMSSTHPEWIERGKALMTNEWINLILTTATTFLPLSYMALILEVYILTPVLVVIVLISMIKITWAERNGKKLLVTSIILHTLAKSYFIFSKVINKPDVMSNFPEFLNSPYKIIIFGMLYTFVSLYCLFNYAKKHPEKHYLNLYVFFNLIDMLQFIMLFTPYYLI